MHNFLLPFVSIRFQILFTPFWRVLFTFPSRYLCTIGHQRVFSLTRWFWQIPTDFHLFRSTWDTYKSRMHFRLQGFHLLWRTFPGASTNASFCNSLISIRIDQYVPQHRHHKGRILCMMLGLGWSPFARHYSGNYDCSLFQGVLRCFSSPRLLSHAYRFSMEFPDITREGLPHSDIPGSKTASVYPRLFAGNHVLHRLLVPRHPPYALSNFSINFYWYTGNYPLNADGCINELVKKTRIWL